MIQGIKEIHPQLHLKVFTPRKFDFSPITLPR